MTKVETEWGRVCKRVWVAALLFPSLVQSSLLPRYHHVEHLLTPFSWTLLSGAQIHPQINGQQTRVSTKFYRCSFYPYPISYLRIVNKIQWAVLIFCLVCWPVASTIANRAWQGTEKNYTHAQIPIRLFALRFTFAPNGKREFVPRDQVFPLIVGYFLLLKNK